MIQHLDEMDKVYRSLLKPQRRDDILESELLKKQINDYEIFIKYLNIYISDIQIRIRRLNKMYEKELERESIK